MSEEVSLGSENDSSPAPLPPSKPLKKGSLVKLDRSAYLNSLEAKSSDQDIPNYLLDGPGELLSIKGEYAQVRWRMPVPDVWLRIDQLKEWS